jgi:hypothetical protein
MSNTNSQYGEALEKCREVFVKKTHDYGSAWRILRTSSLTDQIFIKAQRIRTLEEKGVSKVDEGIESEFIGIVNYSIMALIQLELGSESETDMSRERAITLFNHIGQQAKELMIRKNHDYGEAWRSMRTSSFTDLILMKILRIKQIEDNKGKTLASEGIDANYFDMVNYAIFALIKLAGEKR